MTTSPKSKSAKFERQIERIHQLVESEDSEVTWDDKIPDPDNPEQSRQIDITIRRDGRTTLVECRFHRNKQDVQWIEELIGRKASLRANGVIAVSASGFTSGAIKKSEQFGIILRTVHNLSETEIRDWGKATIVKAVFYEFTNVTLVIKLPKTERQAKAAFINEDGSPVQWRGLFQLAMNDLDGNGDLDDNKLQVDMEVFSSILVYGVRPTEMRMQATVARIRQDVSLVSVLSYRSPEEDSAEYAHVARYDLGEFEILQSKLDDEEHEVAVVVDTSLITVPPNCFFHNIWMDFGHIVTTKWFKIIGAPEAMIWQAAMRFRLEFV